MSFESDLKRMEEITELLKNPETGLERSVELYEKGNKLGEVKYGKNDVMEINIYNFCTLKRKLDSQKGKMYIITPAKDKRNDIYIGINLILDKGIGGGITIY